MLQVVWQSWWLRQMETFSALLAICAGNSPVPGEFPTQRPVTRSFDVCFDLRPNKRLSKQSWGWWLVTLSSPLWRHRNGHRITRSCVVHGLVRYDYMLVWRWSYTFNAHIHIVSRVWVIYEFTREMILYLLIERTIFLNYVKLCSYGSKTLSDRLIWVKNVKCVLDIFL